MNLIWKERMGVKYNNLTLIDYIGEGKFKCKCGNLTVKRFTDVNKGKTKSCGCLKLKQRTVNMKGNKFNNLLCIEELELVNG